LIAFAFPDHLHGRVYEKDIHGRLRPGATLLFLAGMSVHFGFVTPPDSCDVIMIAPHAPGVAMRENYLSGESVSAFYGVHQDASGRATATARELALALGIARNRLVQTTFEHEALGDLFGEQVVLCGGLAMLLKLGFETLLKKGLPPENAYLEVVHQIDLLVDLVKKRGIEGMLSRISVAARYGSVEAGPQIFDDSVAERMEDVFDGIASGEFPRKLNSLSVKDVTRLKKNLKQLSHPLLEKYRRKYSE
jgi:ketol-acid reductoisomerase